MKNKIYIVTIIMGRYTWLDNAYDMILYTHRVSAEDKNSAKDLSMQKTIAWQQRENILGKEVIFCEATKT